MLNKLIKIFVIFCTLCIHVIGVTYAEEIPNKDAKLGDEADQLAKLMFLLHFSDQSVETDEIQIPFYQLYEGQDCEDIEISKQHLPIHRNYCADGYLNLCEFNDLEHYLEKHSNSLMSITIDPGVYSKSAWDIQGIEALKLMHNCNNGDPEACIIVSDYISEFMGHEAGRISGCTLENFDRYDQRLIKRANWLLKGAKLASSKALRSYIAATDTCSGLIEYGTEKDCQNGRKAQIQILEKLRSLEQASDEFSSILENALGDAYAYTAQYQRSYMSHSKACELQNPRSCFELGHQASHGYGFLPKNHLKAVQYFDRAIYLGDQTEDPQTEKFLIYTDPDSPIFDLQKAASAVENCSKKSRHCREKLLALVAYLGDTIISWQKFDNLVMDFEYKYKYANQQMYDFPIFGPSDFSDSFYSSNSFWFQISSIYYLGPMLKRCYARDADACLLLSYVFSNSIWEDTGILKLPSEKLERRSVLMLLPKPNAMLSYKYLLMSERANLSERYLDRYFELSHKMEISLSAQEKSSVQDAATSAKLWAFED